MKTKVILTGGAAALAMTAGWACGGGSPEPGDATEVASNAPLSIQELAAKDAIWEDLEENWDARIAQFYKDAALDPELQSEKPQKIKWVPDVKTAIERATAEDKPIFVAHYVRQNGDPACDV